MDGPLSDEAYWAGKIEGYERLLEDIERVRRMLGPRKRIAVVAPGGDEISGAAGSTGLHLVAERASAEFIDRVSTFIKKTATLGYFAAHV